MDFLDKVQPFLLSEDLIVQRFTLQMLEDYPHVPEEWTELLLKESFNSNNQANVLVHLNKFPFNDKATELVMEGLKIADTSSHHLYIDLLPKGSPEVVWKNREELKAFLDVIDFPFYRLLTEGKENDLWEEYGQALASLEEEPYFNQTMYSRAKQLLDKIVKRGWLDETEVALILREELQEDFFSYKGIFAIYLIKVLQLPQYIPLLVTLLDRDEDILLEETADALISFQSDVVVELVKPYALMEQSSIFAIAVISGTKTPYATEVLRELMEEIELEDDLSLVFEGLTQQLSIEALPEVEKYLDANPISYMINVEECAYAFYKIMGLEHPQLNKWKLKAEEINSKYYEELVTEMRPIQTVSQKVGRNDPCLCGSGKKYKKCCGA